MKKRNWSGRTDGTRGMQSALISIFRVVDVRLVYAVMAVVIIFYMIFQRRTCKVQYNYFRSCYSFGCLKSVWCVYRNHYQFGQVVLDRFAAYAGQHFDILCDDMTPFQALTKAEDGAIILQSHIGNFEMAGYFLSTSQKRMNVLAFSGESEVVMANRKRLFEKGNIHLIPTQSDFGHVFELYSLLQQGELICLPGDRHFGSAKQIEVVFFGRKAQLPFGPFRLITQSGKKALALFVMKERKKQYHLSVFELNNDNEKISMNDLAQRYANILEQMTRKYPYQWYHYYNFWE